MHRFAPVSVIVTFVCVAWGAAVRAHPTADNALDVVIHPDKVVIDARVTGEQVMVVEGGGATPPPIPFWPELPRSHGDYVLKHLHVKADGAPLTGRVEEPVGDGGAAAASPPTTRPEMPSLALRFVYPLASPAEVVRLDQSLLREFEPWTAACVVRVRQSTQGEFQTALLTRERSIEFGCDWSGGAATRPAVAATHTEVRFWPTLREYTYHGVHHILTGYDHLLFVTALVLAATKLWDLVKVVTAFTVAHTLTLTLSTLNLVTLGSHVVEPMIAASIVFVALQNVFWPRQATGWARLAAAFAFGLFHGLGYAGGMRDAMSELPATAFVTALVAFTVGVELAHQMVLLPSYGVLRAARGLASSPESRAAVAAAVMRYGSVAVSVGGAYFLVRAVV
jgi:hydrogenase/urease accessory protein HupE